MPGKKKNLILARLNNFCMRKVIIACLVIFSNFAAFEADAQLDKRYFFWVGRNLLLEDKYEAAIETINILLKTDPDLHEAYFMRAIAKYNLGDLLGAEYDFSLAIEKNPVYTMAYNFRAITRTQIGNYDDALNDFQEAIDLRPDLPGPYYSRGVTYLQSGQYEKALEDLDRFIRRNDKDVEAYLVRGEAYLNLKDTTRAYEQYDKAIRTNYFDPSGYYRRGLLRAMQDDDGEALADFNKSIECDSTYLPAYFSRAIIYSRTQRPMQALEDLDRVIAIDSSYMVAFFNRAIVQTSIGNYNKALDDYNTVARYNPNNVLVYYNRAGLQTYLGDYRAAIADYSKAIDLYPEFANAYLFRSELRAMLMDERGSRDDRRTAEQKIAEYRSKLADSTYSIYADTSRNFQQMLSFDTKFARGEMPAAVAVSSGADMGMMPMFRFLLARHEENTPAFATYRPREMETFEREVDNPDMRFTLRESDISTDEIIGIDRELERQIAANNADWLKLFERGITQTLIKQYTNAVNSLSEAIERNPSNPFLYFNRSATRAEMIDFVSSLESSYQNVMIDSDPANRLKNNTVRTYNYDEAISDLNKAIKLLPGFAYSYYNRGNLQVLSGRMPDAYDDYTQAIELYPNFAEAYFNRGLVQIYMKDTRKGLLDLSKAGELGIKEAYQVLKAYSELE